MLECIIKVVAKQAPPRPPLWAAANGARNARAPHSTQLSKGGEGTGGEAAREERETFLKLISIPVPLFSFSPSRLLSSVVLNQIHRRPGVPGLSLSLYLWFES